ncbi:hypothetical protein TorRG33x02_077250 [Trema orientale]|uniref:Uncharacterized protein n=1 Tax=Trema orientale TaxID=63057 RepID=A0A2P5FF88_TREOI|nr:hypothetical protein TorRG33x02_077250 [Trema orientale]
MPCTLPLHDAEISTLKQSTCISVGPQQAHAQHSDHWSVHWSCQPMSCGPVCGSCTVNLP